MFDSHYDLLTILYLLKDNKKYIDKICLDTTNNLVGIIGNLYFMSEKEMKDELGIEENINVSSMLEKALSVFNSLDLNYKTVFSIEGCDYIKDLRELEYLNSLGLKAILPVWNNENKYGSGIRGTGGLTEEGKKLIEKAIDLNIAIDLSHASPKTFFDIVKVIKEYDKKAICYASHSNVYSLHPHPRNLTDKQLTALKEIDGSLGIVSYPPFLTNSKDVKDIKQAYLNHIKYAVDKMGINRVMLASDNMEFYGELNTKPSFCPSPFKYENMKEEITRLLKSEFNSEEIEKIMYKNAVDIYKKLKWSSHW